MPYIFRLVFVGCLSLSNAHPAHFMMCISQDNTPTTKGLSSVLSDEVISNPSTLTFEHLAALLNSGLAQGYSDNERQALARALLRYNAHLDGTHYSTRMRDGLHPWYVGFNPGPEETVRSKRQLIEASLRDLFDAVSRYTQGNRVPSKTHFYL